MPAWKDARQETVGFVLVGGRSHRLSNNRLTICASSAPCNQVSGTHVPPSCCQALRHSRRSAYSVWPLGSTPSNPVLALVFAQELKAVNCSDTSSGGSSVLCHSNRLETCATASQQSGRLQSMRDCNENSHTHGDRRANQENS
jgi:hypothetical protein